MEIGSGLQSQPYTILRIKRKRNEEPLDALVIESRVRRKKSRGGVGVFQYAQTVENEAWQNDEQQKVIQECISRLARETTAASGETSPTSARNREEPRRYTIVENEAISQPTAKAPANPPQILATKDTQPRTLPDFRMYDAIPSDEKVMSSEHDAEMEKFLPMLNDYLKIHDVTPSPNNSHSSKRAGSIGPIIPSTSSDDYVWDVFYHRPITLSQWNEAANVGTLIGLPPSFGDSYDSASESEEEDEADEDSNAEEYYKNDYPDEEEYSTTDDNDEFHDDSDYDDLMHYKDNVEDRF